MIEKERWQREKMHLLARAGLAEFADPGPLLDILESGVFAQCQTTNYNAVSNPHLKLRKDGMLYISTPAADPQEGGPLGEFFPQRHDVPLAQVLETFNNQGGMLRSFEHWQ